MAAVSIRMYYIQFCVQLISLLLETALDHVCYLLLYLPTDGNFKSVISYGPVTRGIFLTFFECELYLIFLLLVL